MEIRPSSMPYKQSCLSRTDMSKGRLQQVDIPLKQEVNNPEEDSNNSKEEVHGIQALEEEVVETPPEEVEDNKHSLLEEEEAVTITVTRGISNVIVAINLGTIALNAEGKLRWRYVSKPTMQRRMTEKKLHFLSNKNLARNRKIYGI
jgi:hypothetical protein